jgi:hypothetical protein
MTLFKKSVILKDWSLNPPLSEGLDITHRKNENNEDYATLVGTKQQINSYLQDANILSDRLRTLNSLPKYRIIGTKKELIW